MNKISLIILLIIVSVVNTFSQTYTFRNITEKDGLSGNTVIDIFQDSWGFLWFVTPDGVNHYNGYEFTVFRNDPFDSNTISPGITTTISQDSNEKIWIGTTRGLNQYDRLTNSFKYYSNDDGLSFHQVTNLFNDNEGTLWVGMGDIIGRMDKGGLAYFNSESNNFVSFTYDSLDENSISHNHVTSIVEDETGNLWIGTSDGLNKFDKLSKSFTRFYYNKSIKQKKAVSPINDLFYDSNENLWIATNLGLFKFVEQTEEFLKIEFSSSKNSEIKKVLTVYEAPSDKGILWFGTEGGLYEYDIKSGLSNHYNKQKNVLESLPSNEIKEILEDHSGILWIAAGNSGLAKLNRFAPNFKYINTDILSTFASENNVFSIIKNDRGNILAGTYENIIEIVNSPRSKKVLKLSPKLANSLKHNRVVSIHEDNYRRLWIGTSNNGIIVVDSNDVIAHLDENSSVASNKLQSNRISFIASKDNKNIWIGSKGGGLDRVDAETLNITSYSLNDSTTGNKTNLLSYYIDGNGFMWIGTTRGIKKFDLNENQIVQFEHELEFNKYIGEDMILNFAQTKSTSDILWLGTFNGGLCKLNLSNGEFKRITMQNSSLPSNTIKSMLNYGSNTLWLSTDNGLVRFDTKSENIRIYSNDDGSENAQYNINSVFADKSGRFYFGGTKGILNFDPSKVRKNLYLPRLVIDDFLINGKSIMRKGNKTFVQHIIDEGEIILNHNQNSITIDFAALHFASPKNNKYEYQLINYDDNPIRSTERRRLTYMNLSPGDYTFILKAANADGIIAAREIEFDIFINPPLYKTWWAYSFYILILIGLFFGYRKYVITKQLEVARLKESELRAEQAELKAEASAAEAKVIQIESERQTKELEDARKLQLSMLPESIPELDKYEIAVYMKTASEVGGDYYDFSISDDGTLNIGFGDATGHGMQAGVVVSLIKGLFVSDSAENDLATFMMKSNNTIKKSRLGRMMMAFSLLKLKDYSVHISSAGMPPIFIYSASNKQVNEINLMGMPLGAMLNFPFRDIQIQVAKGDTILLISDGLPEMTNKSGEQFDYFRVSKLFKEIGSRSPDKIIKTIIEASDEWLDGNALDDDITLMLIKIK